jgi:hypothetical protein
MSTGSSTPSIPFRSIYRLIQSVLPQLTFSFHRHQSIVRPNGADPLPLPRVLDFDMAGMDGNQIAEVMMKEQPKLPVIISNRCHQLGPLGDMETSQ